MRPRSIPLALLFVSLVGASLPAGAGESVAPGPVVDPIDVDPDATHGAWVPGEVLVQYRAGAGKRDVRSIPAEVEARVTSRIGLYDVAVLDLDKDMGVREAVRVLTRHPAVKSVTPNYLGRFEEVPDDPRFEEQWGMHNVGQEHLSTAFGGSPRGKPDADIDVPRAWETQEGDPETVVAVVDTGVDIKHPDLNESIWTNPGEIPRDGLDNDGNGYVDDVHGWDVAEDDNTLVERDRRAVPYQHGTHIAGIIAAEKDNDLGVAGVCPGCRVMPVKISEPVGDGPYRYMSFRLSDELEGLAYAQSMGADIVNASFGRSRWIRVERDAFVELGRAGALTVVAAGNSSANLDTITSTATVDPTRIGRSANLAYPAAYNVPSIITVAASADHDQYGTFTNYGRDSVDLAAPGVDTFSTIPDGRYQLMSGTSMSAPHVAGAAGLVKSAHPTTTPSGLRHMLMNAVDEPGRMSLAKAEESGYVTRTFGRLNAADALLASPTGRFGSGDGNIRGARSLRNRVKARLHSPKDFNDVFEKRLEESTRVVITLRSLGTPLDLFVWKPKTKEIWQLEEPCFSGGKSCRLRDFAAGPGRLKRVRFEIGRTGTYYLHVSGREDDRGRYVLKIEER